MKFLFNMLVAQTILVSLIALDRRQTQTAIAAQRRHVVYDVQNWFVG